MLLQGAMSGSVVLSQMESVLMSEAHVTTQNPFRCPGLGCGPKAMLRSELFAELAPPLTCSGRVGLAPSLWWEGAGPTSYLGSLEELAPVAWALESRPCSSSAVWWYGHWRDVFSPPHPHPRYLPPATCGRQVSWP